MRSRTHTAFKAALLCIALMLAGCSMLRLAYSNGESLTYWWLDSYVDVSSDQRTAVKERIAGLFDWHRKTQLRDYIGLLTQAQKRLQPGLDKATVLADVAELRKRAIVLLDQALPDLADLALALKPEQLRNIEKKFNEINRQYRKDYLRGDLQKRQRYRYDKVMDQAEYWFGDFNREQEQQIRKLVDAVPLDNELYLAARQRRQRELLAMLGKIQAERPAREQAMLLIREYGVNMIERPGGAEYGAFYEAYYDGMANVAAAIVNLATPAQKQHAERKLQDFIDDFAVLAPPQ